MEAVETYWARIYVGFRKAYDIGYSHDIVGKVLADSVIQKYVDKIGLCVNVQQTEFFYTGGHEHGIVVELINYPRFPTTKTVIRSKAINLAKKLKEQLEQNRVSIMFPDETVMLGKKED